MNIIMKNVKKNCYFYEMLSDKIKQKAQKVLKKKKKIRKLMF